MARAEWMHAALAWVLTYALHSTALLALAWLLARTVARGSLRGREALWKSALIGGILTASVQVGADLEPLAGRWWVRTAAAQEERPDARHPDRPTRRERPPEAVTAPSPPRLAPDAGDALEALGVEEGPVERRELPADVVLARPTELEARPATPPASAPSGTRTREREVARALPSNAPEAETSDPPSVPALVARASEPAREASEPTPAAPPPSLTRSIPSQLSRSWPLVLLGLWLTGGLLGLLLLAWAWRHLADLVAGRERLTEGPLLDQLHELCRRAGLRRAPPLSVSDRIASPATIGVLRPQICVPRRALDELAPEHREAMLAHELAHVARRDPQWSFLGRAIERALFFQPLNRIARRELAELAEYRADDWAVRQTGRGVCLARCLAEVATWVLERRPAIGLLPMAERGSQLGRRIRRLLEEGEAAPERGRLWTPLAPCAVAAVTLVLPGAATGERAPAAPAIEPAAAGADVEEPLPAPAPPADPRAQLAADIDALVELLDAEVAELTTEVDALAHLVEDRALETSFADALTGITAQVSSLREKKERLDRLLPAVLELAEARPSESERPGTGPRPSLRAPRQDSPTLEAE